MSEKWLVISNCQTQGLANSFSLLCPHAEIVACDYWKFVAEADLWRAKVHDFHWLIINPEIQDLGLIDFSAMPNVSFVPAIFFRAFHPDLLNVFHDGKPIKTPLDSYHSSIVFAAYKLGLSVDQISPLFRTELYECVGYYSLWESEKAALLSKFDQYGIDLRLEFIKWVRQGAFMHSFNHPKIDAIFGLASIVARKIAGDLVVESKIIPHDNILSGSIYPVFPEIAARYNAGSGSYFFKEALRYRLITLREFISASCIAYDAYKVEDIHGNSPHLDLITQFIRSRA